MLLDGTAKCWNMLPCRWLLQMLNQHWQHRGTSLPGCGWLAGSRQLSGQAAPPRERRVHLALKGVGGDPQPGATSWPANWPSGFRRLSVLEHVSLHVTPKVKPAKKGSRAMRLFVCLALLSARAACTPSRPSRRGQLLAAAEAPGHDVQVPVLSDMLRQRSLLVHANRSAVRTVILTYMTPEYRALTNNLLCSLNQVSLLEHTVVAVNQSSDCMSLAPEYRSACAVAEAVAEADAAADMLMLRSGDFGSKDYYKRILFKPGLFGEAIGQGVNLIFLDGDIVVQKELLTEWQKKCARAPPPFSRLRARAYGTARLPLTCSRPLRPLHQCDGRGQRFPRPARWLRRRPPKICQCLPECVYGRFHPASHPSGQSIATGVATFDRNTARPRPSYWRPEPPGGGLGEREGAAGAPSLEVL